MLTQQEKAAANARSYRAITGKTPPADPYYGPYASWNEDGTHREVRPNPRPKPGMGRAGTLTGVTAEAITASLGFAPNAGPSDDGKVTVEWRFNYYGASYAIWDYKGSAAYGQFSVGYTGRMAGFTSLFNELFGTAFTFGG